MACGWMELSGSWYGTDPATLDASCREAKRQGRGAGCFSLRLNAQDGTGKSHCACPSLRSAGTG